MKKSFILSVAVCLLAAAPSWAAGKKKSEPKEDYVFTTVKENPITSIKNQNQSGTCWCFSSLSYLEAELLRMGKGTYDLCESFVVYNTYMDRARAAVRTHGDVSFSQGGSFYDVIYCLKNYGMVPQEAMAAQGSLYGDSLYNHNELDAVTTAYVGAIAKNTGLKKLTPCWINGLAGIYDAYLGKLPQTFTVNGKSYTPKTYAESLGLNPDDYVSLTSFTHHPFYTSFVIEVQDNWRWAQSYNLPLDEFMETMEYAIKNGYTFAWGADVSEKGFGRNGIATVPLEKGERDMAGSDAARWTGTNKTNDKKAEQADKFAEKTITQEMRQQAYDNWETTDDHGMVIYGIAKDQRGNEVFMVENSWGNYGKYHGIFYASKPYVAYKTMNILINKHAIPAAIAAKLGIK